MPEVSVVIAARNAGRTIDAALASVFAQTVRDLEVIVVDDGSTDDTTARVDAFGSRVIRLRQTAGGLGAALRAALPLSRGRIVMLLDPADLWLPRKVERQLTYFERFPGTGLLHGTAIPSGTPATALLESSDAAPLTTGFVAPTKAGAWTPEPEGTALSTIATSEESDVNWWAWPLACAARRVTSAAERVTLRA